MNTYIVKRCICTYTHITKISVFSVTATRALSSQRFDEDLPGTSRFRLQRAHILPRMSWAVQWVGTRDLIWSRRFCYRVEGLGFVYIRSCAARFSLSLSLSYSKCHRSASSFRNIDAMYKCWNKRTTSLKLGVIAIIEIENGFSDTVMGVRRSTGISLPRLLWLDVHVKMELHFPGYSSKPKVSITNKPFLFHTQSPQLRSRCPAS